MEEVIQEVNSESSENSVDVTNEGNLSIADLATNLMQRREGEDTQSTDVEAEPVEEATEEVEAEDQSTEEPDESEEESTEPPAEPSDVLSKFGLVLEERVEGGVEIVSVPTGVAGNIQDCIDSVLEALRDGTWSDEEGRREKLAKVWAKSGAIPKTKKLSDEETSAMIGGLFSCKSPATDPWGRSVFATFDAQSIDGILG